MAYSLPSAAEPFELNISDQAISEWRQLLQLSKIGPDTYEGRQEDRRFGVSRQWLSDTKDYWLNKYDWRAQEAHINSFDNFKMSIEDLNVHFIGYFSEKKDAIPLILMHGWPGSFIEFLPMLEIIKKQYSPKDLPYHVIIPSLPGYTLTSGPPVDQDWTIYDSARIMNQLMLNLGFEKYIAQGGDIGSLLARIMTLEYDACVGVHLNLWLSREEPDESSMTETEKKAHQKAQIWAQTGRAYAIMQSTRPSTIGQILATNPLALLAWIGEKFLEWSDVNPAIDDILTNISLYWFTESYARSIHPYRMQKLPFEYHEKPTGFSFFPMEVLLGSKGIVEKGCNLVFHKTHEHGGHFAALELPKELWEDIEEFVRKVWKV